MGFADSMKKLGKDILKNVGSIGKVNSSDFPVGTIIHFSETDGDASMTFTYGRAFIKTYYAISPTLVKWFGNKKAFKRMFLPSLDRMVETLNKKGYQNTPYIDKNY